MSGTVRRLLVLFLLAAPLTEARAGAPFITDDPEPVEPRHWEVYLASQHTDDKNGWSGALPFVDINYGAVPDVQLHLISPMAYDKPKRVALHYGYGDMEAGAKVRFVQETTHSPQAAIYPMLELPTGEQEKGLGQGHARLFLPLWLQKSFGPWTTYGGGGYWINPGAGNKNWVYFGWELQRDLSKKLMVGAEFIRRTANAVDASWSEGFNVGGVYHLDEVHHLQFSIGRDFHGPDRLTTFFAFLWTTPS